MLFLMVKFPFLDSKPTPADTDTLFENVEKCGKIDDSKIDPG